MEQSLISFPMEGVWWDPGGSSLCDQDSRKVFLLLEALWMIAVDLKA
jgi:hypothetical protein